MTENHWDVSHLAAGDRLHVQVMKEGGRPYRTWTSVVERADPERIVTWSPPGCIVRSRVRPTHDEDVGFHEWHSPWGMRNVYWPGRPYNMLEIYHPDGRLEELYVHVAGPPTLVDHLITWTDYELDVVLRPGGTPEIIDEDEFAEAALAYGYSAQFQARCYEIARDLAEFLNGWTPSPPPAMNL